MENEHLTSIESEQTDFLQHEDTQLYQHEYATQGQRFVNWLVDNLLLRYGLSYLTSTGVVMILNMISPDLLYNIVFDEYGRENKAGLLFVGYLIVIANYLIYYTLCEKLFKGYTLGKLISGTRAIRQDGNELTLRNAFLRSLSRLVPFEVFSGFSTLAWHDRWTDTMVIKAR